MAFFKRKLRLFGPLRFKPWRNIFMHSHQHHPRLFWVIIFSLGFGGMAALFYFYIAFLMPLPAVFFQPVEVATTKIFDRNRILLYEILQPDQGKKTLVKLEQMPVFFVKATLAAEDIHFYEHGGVDPYAILRAIFFNVREQRIVSGASTITQQLVHNILELGPNRSFSDKALEALYAIRLSNIYDKNQILELYLNKIYYGNMAYGAESAALDFFGKHLTELDLAQSSLIAGLPQSPSSYNPFVYFDRAKLRQKYVLDQMVKYQFIKRTEADAAFEEPLHLRRNRVEMKAPHFVYYVMSQLDSQLGSQADSRNLAKGGFSIYTTLDYHLQQMAETNVSRQVGLLKDKNVTNGALLSIDPKTSQILAWVGSENYFDEKIDGAVDMITALRQPGSALKPFTYLLAFEKGMTPATILNDIPSQFPTEQGPYEPKNYDLKYHGPVRVRNALASSFNIPAVQTLEFVGLQNFIGFLEKFGITTLDQSADFYGLALTLGGGEVRMLDLAKAYNVIANYGFQQQLSSVLAIQNSKGDDLYHWSTPSTSFLLGPNGKQHAYQIIDILKDPTARLGGFGEGNVLELSREAAVKTGTTRNFRDNWTVGFTPQLLTAVWVGNADATPMFNISGIDGAGPIWHDFMEEAEQFLPHQIFQNPGGLKQVEICALSGKLPTLFCPERVLEWFVKGTEPKVADDFYQNFYEDPITGTLIDPACLQKIEPGHEKTVIVYPPELQKWAQSEGYPLPTIKRCEKSNAGKPVSNQIFMIDSPQPGDEYQLESSLPFKDQKIPLRVTVPLEAREVSFFVDEKKVGTVNSLPYTYLWLPEKGVHSMWAEVTLENGKILKSSKVNFGIK